MADTKTLAAPSGPVDVSGYEIARAEVEQQVLDGLSFEGYAALVASKFPGVHWRASLRAAAVGGVPAFH